VEAATSSRTARAKRLRQSDCVGTSAPPPRHQRHHRLVAAASEAEVEAEAEAEMEQEERPPGAS
jgi:hypothetical protein